MAPIGAAGLRSALAAIAGALFPDFTELKPY